MGNRRSLEMENQWFKWGINGETGGIKRNEWETCGM